MTHAASACPRARRLQLGQAEVRLVRRERRAVREGRPPDAQEGRRRAHLLVRVRAPRRRTTPRPCSALSSTRTHARCRSSSRVHSMLRSTSSCASSPLVAKCCLTSEKRSCISCSVRSSGDAAAAVHAGEVSRRDGGSVYRSGVSIDEAVHRRPKCSTSLVGVKSDFKSHILPGALQRPCVWQQIAKLCLLCVVRSSGVVVT